ncbi:MAG: restriction modification system DNA specificity domain protein, nonfunctional [Candidatus Moranbacteria bacterium GW2011_GWF2_36_839]|nr:MAG: restriction modification system DNA specificity domain protein, nonfunctional [Candidatus Moranbacteria bacterium GW2011_GWF2_36_839]
MVTLQPVGRVVIFNKKDGDFSFSNFTSAIRIKNSRELDFNFLHRFLFFSYISGITEKMQSHSTGIRNLDSKLYKSIEIPFPPLPEQHRIVKILDVVFENIEKAKENAQKNLQNSKELFELYLENIFISSGNNWDDKTLGEIATFRNGMNFTKRSRGETIKIVGVKDFQKNFWIPLENLESVTIDGKLNETDYLRENDILTVRSNGNPKLIGRCMLAGRVIEKISHSGFTIRIRLISNRNFAQYICHYLKSKIAKKHLIESGTGINIKSLNQVALSSLVIPIPSLKEQKSIVAKLDALSAETKKLEAIYQQKLADLEELKKSVLKKAFAGEL